MQHPNNIKAAINLIQAGRHSVISFDMFDTMVFRPYLNPHDLYKHLGLIHNLDEFAAARIAAEDIAIAALRDRVVADITLDFIYENMPAKYQHMKQAEIDLEIQTIQPNPEMRPVFNAAIASGKKVVITTDMYLPRNALERILAKCGYIGHDRLYISSEVGLRKSRGDLFEYIISDLNTIPGSILHIGDNPHSDEKVPATLGINTALYPPVIKNIIEERTPAALIAAAQNDVGLSIVLTMNAMRIHATQNGTPLNDIGYLYGGPAIWGYARFIADVAKTNGMKKLLFMARDSHLLKQVFDEMNTGIKTDYIFAGRLMRPQAKRVHRFGKKTPFQKYVLRITRGRHVGMVDGQTLNFSSQRILETITGREIPAIYFFAFGTHKDLIKTHTHAAFLSQDTYSVADVIEMLMTSTEMPITGVNKRGEFEYQHDPHFHEITFRTRQYPQIEFGIRQFICDMKRIFGNHDIYITGNGMFELMHAFLYTPSKTELTALSKINFAYGGEHRDIRNMRPPDQGPK